MLDSCKDLVDQRVSISLLLNCTVHSTPTLGLFTRQHLEQITSQQNLTLEYETTEEDILL